MKKNYLKYLENLLLKFRLQGMQVNEVNPITALSDTIVEDIYSKKININCLENCLHELSFKLWDYQISSLNMQLGMKKISQNIIDLKNLDIEKEIYRAVFTAHPVFALSKNTSENICKSVEGKKKSIDKKFYSPREKISLKDEHNEAMTAIFNARKGISYLNKEILNIRKKNNIPNWKEKLPLMMGVSSWIGYDLDGRTDISWIDSFCLRLFEKKQALSYYIDNLQSLGLKELKELIKDLEKELRFTEIDIKGFSSIKDDSKCFSKIINLFTERANKLISSYTLAYRLHQIAKKVSNDQDCISLMIIAADIKKHGYGIAEVHLRVNATQIHNAMSSELGWDNFNKPNLISSKNLLDKLSNKIIKEKKWKINFKNLDEESAIAKRQLMLATQIIKYVDSDQSIRFLVAECEQSISIFSSLFLAKKLDIDKKIDISPLFETRHGLEYGEEVIKDLLSQNIFVDYIKSRGRISIQTGFSDAGRFIGQIAASFAIEKLQLKIAEILFKKKDLNIDFLLFNTHGESLGRAGTQSNIEDRQSYIITPYVRQNIFRMKLHLNHQTSFQGGDGYRLFGTIKLAKITIRNLFLIESDKKLNKISKDKFYEKPNFSLDFFLNLKSWHNDMFSSRAYADLVTIFSTNLLPVSGSRPSKRMETKKNLDKSLSEIRAITHNAILQQLGFLANVISGFGKSANLDLDQFLKIYKSSDRLKQVLKHVIKAKSIGSLNTLLSYCKIIDPGFWVDKAYHEQQTLNKYAYRKIGEHLESDKRVSRIRQLIWRLRDDLIDLYAITEKTGQKSIRTSGKERVNLDILHAIRIALIIESLVIISKTPKLSDSNKFNNSDILECGISLDFDGVINIIRSTFTTNKNYKDGSELKEKENYSSKNQSNLKVMEKEIIKPLKKNSNLIKRITQLISINHGAFG